jgi:hypothetical protein
MVTESSWNLEKNQQPKAPNACGKLCGQKSGGPGTPTLSPPSPTPNLLNSLSVLEGLRCFFGDNREKTFDRSGW